MSARRAFFFRADRCLGYDLDRKVVDAGPGAIADLWPSLPAGFCDVDGEGHGVDAVVTWGDGTAYLLRGDRCVRVDVERRTVVAGPLPIAEVWQLPPEVTQDLDAVVNWGDGHVYFVKGDRCLRYDKDRDVADGASRPIGEVWSALPEEFRSDLDTVVAWGEGHAYFFKGERYLRFDQNREVVDVGPLAVADAWEPLPAEFKRDLDAVVVWTWVDHWERVPLDRRLRYVMERLVDRYGLTVNGAAGLVGNLVAESGVIPSRLEGSAASTPLRSRDFSGTVVDHSPTAVAQRDPVKRVGPKAPGVGLAQWTSSDRRRGLFAHPFNGVALGPRVVFAMDAQLDYLAHELATSYPKVRTVLVDPHTSADVACDEVVYDFEIPGSILDHGHKLQRTDARVQKVFAARRTYAAQALKAYRAAAG